MSGDDLHEAIFDWYHPEANSVVITGAFDNWTGSTHLSKIPGGFEAKVKVPWGQKTLYKYIVDGKWTNDPTKPTEVDHDGNVNNVYEAPAKPAAPLLSAAESMPPTTAQTVLDQTKVTAAVIATQVQSAIQTQTAPASTEKGVDLHPSETLAAPLLDAASSMPPTAAQQALDATVAVKDKVLEVHQTQVAPAVASIQNSIPDGTAQAVKDTAVAAQQIAGDAAQKVHETVVAPAVAAVADTIPEEHKQKVSEIVTPVVEKAKTIDPSIIGADGLGTQGVVPSTLAYVASGLGAAIKTVTGIDPINADKIPVQTPTTETVVGPVETTQINPSADPLPPVPGLPAQPVIEVPAADPSTTEPSKDVIVNGEPSKTAPTSAPTSTPVPAALATPVTTPAEPPALPEKTTTATPSEPETPKKAFPSTEEKGTSSGNSSPSKYDSTRKKRQSFFGKLKNVFHHNHKDSEKETK